MNKPNSYEEVMKELEAVSDLLEFDSNVDLLSFEEDEQGRNFRFEYAHEALTERNSMYKRRNSHA